MSVLGIDLNSFTIDLATLDENTQRAHWHPIKLRGDKAFDRARDVRRQMPTPSWFVNEDIYLVAIERPFIRFGQDVIRLVEGAVLSCIPRELEVWEVSVSQWKKHLSIPIRTKPEPDAFGQFDFVGGDWSQDALDALGVALYARDTNAAAITRGLRGAA